MNIYLYLGLYCVGWLVMFGALFNTPDMTGQTHQYPLATALVSFLWPALLPVFICVRVAAWLMRDGL